MFGQWNILHKGLDLDYTISTTVESFHNLCRSRHVYEICNYLPFNSYQRDGNNIDLVYTNVTFPFFSLMESLVCTCS